MDGATLKAFWLIPRGIFILLYSRVENDKRGGKNGRHGAETFAKKTKGERSQH